MLSKNFIVMGTTVGFFQYYLMKNFIFPKMEDSDYLDVEVKKSLILNSGLGLFAKSEFEKGDIISEFRGPVVDNTETDDPKFKNEDRMLWLNPQYSIIGKLPFNATYSNLTNYCLLF